MLLWRNGFAWVCVRVVDCLGVKMRDKGQLPQETAAHRHENPATLDAFGNPLGAIAFMYERARLILADLNDRSSTVRSDSQGTIVMSPHEAGIVSASVAISFAMKKRYADVYSRATTFKHNHLSLLPQGTLRCVKSHRSNLLLPMRPRVRALRCDLGAANRRRPSSRDDGSAVQA